MLQSGASAAGAWSTSVWPATTTINELLFSSSANNVTGLTAANTAALVTSSTGVPSWVTGAANRVLRSNGTIVSFSQIDPATDFSAVVPLASGGTNAALTASNGGIVWSNATQFQILAGTATAGQMLRSGATAAPTWSTATWPATTTINQLLFSSANNVVGGVTAANSAALVSSSAGVPSWAALTDGQLIVGLSAGTPTARTISGDVTLSSTGVTAIGTAKVTYAMIQNVSATQRLHGRNTAGAGVTEEVTATQVLDWIGSTRGSVLYRGAAGWAALTPGTSGQFLTSGGAGADPSYTTAAGSGTVTSVVIAAGDGIGVTGTCTITISGTCTVASAVKSAFSVHKNGTDQTGIADATYTALTWSTEIYDVGGNFASNTWTPPAGKVTTCFMYQATYTGGATPAVQAAAIYKNGANYKQGTFNTGTSSGAASVCVDDIANGTDAYTTQVFIDIASGTSTVSGNSALTWWTGHWIGP